MIATFIEQTEDCAMIATFKEQTEAALWLPPSMTNPRLCYDCHF